jgi:small subunit ribosomal protein S2
MSVVSMKALLESGVHFGHRTNKWDPRMKPYIFTERNGIHIIDLQQTVKALNHAFSVIRDTVAEGGVVMFVGTKRQAQETILDEANRCGMPYVTNRWLGGMLTNWSTMHQRILDMERMEKQISGEEASRITKKEGLLIQRKIDKLQARLSGVRNMNGLPDLLFVVDINREEAAVHEANLLNIPIVALVDTNCDPSPIDYVIPSNDDAIRAIKLLVGKVSDAVLEGVAMRKDDQDERDAQSRAGYDTPEGKPSRAMELDEELSDADLLGTATLAKLNAKETSEGDETQKDEESSESDAEATGEETSEEEGTSTEENLPEEEEAPEEESSPDEEIPEEDDSLDDEEEVKIKKKPKAKKVVKEEKTAEEDDDALDDEVSENKKKNKSKKTTKVEESTDEISDDSEEE